MKQETNKEIDLLLRRLSRRDGEAARDAGLDDRHLDADELSSYAQNVLPPAARARYTEHLADCSTCRRLATELSLALGVTTAVAPVETVSASSGLKKFLSSLFSPMVLRYAVPALGVIVVMVIGFVVLRQRSASEQMVAQNDVRTAAPETVGRVVATPTPAAGLLAYDDNRGHEAAKGSEKNDAPARSEDAAERPAKSKAPESVDDTVGAMAAAPVATPSDETAFTPRKAGPLPVQPVVTPPKADFTIDGETQAKKESRQDVAKEVAKTTAEQQETKDKAQANEPATANLRPAGRVAADRDNRNRAAAAPTVSTAGAGERATTRRGAAETRDQAETRSVAGRTFRKERGIWTDTAYDSSTRTVEMARGSEQFRGLVADEPAIGTIAEQLDGVVIVVWKGRAYRIR